MPDDRVTIDPEFQPPVRGGERGGWLRLAGVGAVVAAAFIFGWLLRSPSPAEPESTETGLTSTTALTGNANEPSATTTAAADTVGLEVPLGEAVPGFTDSITMTSFDGSEVVIHRWGLSDAAPEIAVTLGEDWRGGRFNGLDASGRWYARLSDDGLLMVHPTTDVDEEAWLGPPHAFVLAARVVTAVWHDTEPGRLAWVTCSLGTLPRPQGDTQPTGTLYTYNLETDLLEEPDAEQTVDARCDAMFVPQPELGRWSVSGLNYWSGYDGVRLQSDGPEIDGDSAPGLASSEWLEDYRWSPDGNLLGYTFHRSGADDPMIRVVDAASGHVLTEIKQPGRELWVAEWSTDSRFLLYRELPGVGAGPPYREGLGFYDTAADTIVVLPLPDSVFEVRTAEPVPATEPFTPFRWGIVPDEEFRGQEVYTVSMEVDFGPLLPDQVEDVSGRLIWQETIVDLCNIGIDLGDGFLNVGDTFQTTEGCGTNPTAMQNAFNEHGFPETACLTVRADGVDYEYCAPLHPGEEVAFALLTVEDLPGEWPEIGTEAGFWLPGGLCSQIPTGRDIFPNAERPASPNYSTPLAEARFGRERTWLSQGIYASGYMTVDQLFTHFKEMLTNCATETDQAVTTSDHTASIDLIDLPGLDRDHVAVEWSIDGEAWASGETRLVIVHLGDALLVLGTWQDWWSSPEESVGVTNAEFAVIVGRAVARAVGGDDA